MVSIKAHQAKCCPKKQNIQKTVFENRLKEARKVGVAIPKTKKMQDYRDQAQADRLETLKKQFEPLGHEIIHVPLADNRGRIPKGEERTRHTSTRIDWHGPFYCRRCRQGARLASGNNKGMSTEEKCPGYKHETIVMKGKERKIQEEKGWRPTPKLMKRLRKGRG